MSSKPGTPRKAAKKRILVTIIITGALIIVVAVIVRAHDHRASSSSPAAPAALESGRASAPAKPAPAPSGAQSTQAAQSLAGTTPETDEYSAPVYTNYAGPSGLQRSLSNGQVVLVYCRVPGNSSTPPSVGDAGWYQIKTGVDRVGYAAADRFYNDPGNGYGMKPNKRTFDPAVPACTN
jgi:hypothetical protein